MTTHRSPAVRRIHRRAAVILTGTALLLATLMGAAAAAQAGPASPQPTYTLHEGYGVLHDFGVPGNEAQISALLTDTCARMSTDQASMLAVQVQLSGLYPGQGGDVMGIASDVYCPQFRDPIMTLARSEISGH